MPGLAARAAPPSPHQPPSGATITGTTRQPNFSDALPRTLLSRQLESATSGTAARRPALLVALPSCLNAEDWRRDFLQREPRGASRETPATRLLERSGRCGCRLGPWETRTPPSEKKRNRRKKRPPRPLRVEPERISAKLPPVSNGRPRNALRHRLRARGKQAPRCSPRFAGSLPLPPLRCALGTPALPPLRCALGTPAPVA